MAIAMCAIAIGGVAKNEIGNARNRAKGALITADHRWVPAGGGNGTCSTCLQSDNQSCDVNVTSNPCTCWIDDPGTTFAASTFIGTDPNSSSNCVALYQQP